MNALEIVLYTIIAMLVVIIILEERKLTPCRNLFVVEETEEEQVIKYMLSDEDIDSNCKYDYGEYRVAFVQGIRFAEQYYEIVPEESVDGS